MRFTPGGIRKGAAGYDVCFIHPKGNEATPLSGEGVLIELVQAPPDVIAALAADAVGVALRPRAPAEPRPACGTGFAPPRLRAT